VGPRAGLDTEDRGKILCPCRGSNPDRPVVQHDDIGHGVDQLFKTVCVCVCVWTHPQALKERKLHCYPQNVLSCKRKSEVQNKTSVAIGML
jgi:hypothetical protein